MCIYIYIYVHANVRIYIYIYIYIYMYTHVLQLKFQVSFLFFDGCLHGARSPSCPVPNAGSRIGGLGSF